MKYLPLVFVVAFLASMITSVLWYRFIRKHIVTPALELAKTAKESMGLVKQCIKMFKK